jgi:FtsZ-interacting cell division protein ZipA
LHTLLHTYTNNINEGIQMSIEAVIWALGGAMSVIGLLLATLWQMTRAEQKAQDEAIKSKADTARVSESESRWEKEAQRIREEHDKVTQRLEQNHERDLANMESRLSQKMDTLGENLMRQMQLIMELIKDK